MKVEGSTAQTERRARVRKLSQVGASAVVIALAATAVWSSVEAKGRKPEDVFKGQIILSEQPFPSRFKDNDHFVSHMKRVRQAEFFPDKEGGDWHIEYMAFFAQPLEGRAYSVIFFDITDKKNPVLILEGTSSPKKSGLRIMAGYSELKAEYFQPNKHYLMLYAPSSAEPALAEAEFVLRPYDPQKAEEARRKREETQRAEEAKKGEGKAKPVVGESPKEVPQLGTPDW